MTARTLLAPLVRPVTYRRAVHLLLGGVILLPYVLLATVFTQMLDLPDTPRDAVIVLFVATGVIALVPAFLAGTRTLEIAAARALLGVDVPEPAPGTRLPAETRVRGALWYGMHLAVGGVVGFGLLTALPMALLFAVRPLGIAGPAYDDLRLGPFDGDDVGWLSLTGVALLVGLVYAIAGFGALAALMAPVLLGPSQAERIALLEAHAAQLAERNRLARELHDSVGHALTVVTLQAAAAREVIDADPAFARRALGAIEDRGRAAMDELDQVLGLLRGNAPDLRDLPELLDGMPVDADVAPHLDRLPEAVSRAGYRIVQEGLTNAARHAPDHRVSLRLVVEGDAVTISMSNAFGGTRKASSGGGRGIPGMRERVVALGGTLTVTDDCGEFRVVATLPVTA